MKYTTGEITNMNTQFKVGQCAICDPVWASRTLAPSIRVDCVCECGVEQKVEPVDPAPACVVHYFKDGKEIFPNP